MAKRKVAPGFWWDPDKGVGYVDLRAGGRKGHRVRATIDHLGYKDALRRFGEIKDAALKSARPPRSIPVLRDYWKDFPRLRPIKPSTKASYEYMLNAEVLPALGDVRLDRISAGRLLEFRARLMSRQLAPSTVNRHITLVRMLLAEASQRGLLAANPVPAGSIKPLREREPVVAYLSGSERAAFLATFDDEVAFRSDLATRQVLGPIKLGRSSPLPRRHGGSTRGDSLAAGELFRQFSAAGPLFLCALDTGLSRGDLIRLRWDQVDLANGSIRIERAKTSVPVSVPMTARLLDHLRALGSIGRGERVFLTSQGEPWSESSIKRYFTIAKRLAGIKRPFRFHDMRHDFASALAQEGVSLLVIAQLLGHTSTRMTMRYAHLHQSNLRAAIAALPDRK